MKIEMGKEYTDDLGQMFTILAVKRPGSRALEPQVVAMETGCGVVSLYHADGRGVNRPDLMEMKERIKRTIWLNIYHDGANVYYDKCEADESGPTRFACVSVEIDCEEGEGL